MEYVPIPDRKEFRIAHLTVTAVAVNHIVPTVGLVVSDGKSTVAFSSDTAETDEFWDTINRVPRIDALLIEASFPDSMAKLAEISRHFTPASLQRDLRKLNHNGLDILAVHIKPAYRQMIIDELNALNIPGLGVMEPGRIYNW
jgi:ribonuclease BN (tRNA processing enzyme)